MKYLFPLPTVTTDEMIVHVLFCKMATYLIGAGVGHQVGVPVLGQK